MVRWCGGVGADTVLSGPKDPEAEQIVHIRWPTETFAQARVDVKPMSISFTCIPSRNKAWIAAASSARLKFSAFRQVIMERWCGAFIENL